MKKWIVLICVTWACKSDAPNASQIVDQAINASGVNVLQNARASFDFRGMRYEYVANQGMYSYTRIQTDSLGNEIKDILTNEGLSRYINDRAVVLDDKKKAAYTSSVNSVIYFAFLPFRLHDPAVIKTYAGQTTINEKNYHKIKITFKQEGGGEDYEDVFYYWFDSDDFSLDYLAYSYNEEEGKGIRFREAYNSRKVNGVTIQDYRNYKPVSDQIPLENMDRAFQDGQLELLSVIALENVSIAYPTP